MAIHATFRQEVDESIKTFPPIVLQTNQMELNPDDDLDPMLKSCSEQLQNKITFYEGTGSGWVIENIHCIDTTVWILNPARGESWHPLSDWIANTHSVLNIQNKDNRCFVHAVMGSLYTPVSHRENPYSYSKFYQEKDAPTFNSLIFPM